MDRLILMGDSHTRSYAASSLIDKIYFLNQGRRLNFFSLKNTLCYLVRYLAVSSQDSSHGSCLAVVIGEPDARHIAYGTFDVPGNPQELIDESRTPLGVDSYRNELIVQSITRVRLFLFLASLFHAKPSIILGASSPNRELMEICRVFNGHLMNLAEPQGVYFCEPTSVFWDDSSNKRNWIGVAYNDPSMTDATHFSAEAGTYFDKLIAGNLSNLKHETLNQAYLLNKTIKPLLNGLFVSRYSSKFKVYRLYLRFSPVQSLKKLIDEFLLLLGVSS
jgi:hypothetical protein